MRIALSVSTLACANRRQQCRGRGVEILQRRSDVFAGSPPNGYRRKKYMNAVLAVRCLLADACVPALRGVVQQLFGIEFRRSVQFSWRWLRFRR